MTNIRCSSCGFAEDFRFGIGMRHSSLERCLGEFSYWERQELEAMMEEKEVADYHFCFQLTQCQTCLHLRSRPYIEFLFTDGSRAHSELRCTECRSENVRLIPEEWLDTARCPFCREKGLEKENIGMWD
ncbi:hypothetical protein SAMN05421687_10211 [Salimicrobium flavidum]|uniref:Uncharacterized protein n=2 Tax=Salimicrobium flavidum TaxID=570947 RepID=A0A1N7IR75_9BACI|nr:hypothetical protein SAMN05421687_10211 [Salimicrobium flavidum]